MRLKQVRTLMSMVVIIILLVLCSRGWAQEVGVKPGDVIGKDNYQKAADLAPPAILEHLKKGDFEMRITDYVAPVFTKGFQEATKKGMGKVGLDAKGNLTNWDGGCPFPNVDLKDPQVALKMAWNRDKCLYHGDDHEVDKYRLTLVNPKGTERHIGGLAQSWLTVFYTGRTEIPPIPRIEDGRGIRSQQLTTLDYPYDVKGVVHLKVRYEDETKEDDVWMYLPTIRRVRRMSAAQRGESFGGTDCTYDDITLYMGRCLENTYTYTGEQKLLTHISVLPPYKPAGWARKGVFEEEPYMVTDCYVLELKPLDPNYIYSKRVIWIDKNTWQSAVSQVYDKKGTLWKTAYNNTAKIFTEIGSTLSYGIGFWWYDHQASRGTVYEQLPFTFSHGQMQYAKITSNLDYGVIFSQAFMKERGER